ncbi:ribonuclease H-like domain-containing protein [Macrophomina phaseolina]|uniref:ribonuclease H n=1 Tax=Macrophomina phaseolina TaxID=35725 RepID=A0ABQ8G1U8_9PEZI|nr:ribonuclease H-like domain-containing protein [Macrophomina phaseolina]
MRQEFEKDGLVVPTIMCRHGPRPHMVRLSHSVFQLGCRDVNAGRVFEADRALSEGCTLNAFERAQWDRPVINAPCHGPLCGSCGSPAAHSDSVLIAVDGACRGNGRPDATAACAVFFSQESPYNETHVLSGDGSTPTTSQRAELMGGIKALEVGRRLADDPEEAGLEHLQQIVIKADSMYLVRSATEWIEKWKVRGWTNAKGTPVVNQDLFQLLEDRIQALEHMDIVVQFLHVPRGQNREADAAANRVLNELALRTRLTTPRAGRGLLITPNFTIETCEQLGEDDARPTIDVLSLGALPWFEEMYGSLLDALDDCAHIRRVSTARAALESLTTVATKPAAILVVDAGIAQKGGLDIMNKLAEYVADGGTAIFCCAFSSFVRPSDLNSLFQASFGLSWKAGSYTSGVGYDSALYLSDDFGCRNQTSAAWVRVGRGSVGYVGDVNGEEETDGVILAMCGL